MHLRIDGVDPTLVGSNIFVVAIVDAQDSVETPAFGSGGVAGWVNSDDVSGATPAVPALSGVERCVMGESGFAMVSDIDQIRHAEDPFAWVSELHHLESEPLTTADRVAEWTTVIACGARVLVTRHVPDARRVAVMMSDLLAARAERGAK